MRHLLLAAMLVPAIALGETPSTGPVLVGPEPMVVSGGPGNQTDPHVSATIVSYTNTDSASSEIRYQDLTSPGTDFAIANSGHRDSLSDVSGDIIVFRRVFTDGSSSSRPIFFFDRSQPGVPPQELAPLPGARRESAAIGGDTVAFMQQSGPSSSQSDICVATLTHPSAAAHCLTADGQSNRGPAVSPDGSTVVWTKCLTSGTGCDIYVARRDGAGAWGAPQQLTGAEGEELQADTNGTIVTYVSNAGGDFDIWFQNVDGSDPRQLVLSDATGSTEFNPNISENLIAFERELPGSTNADLYVYDLATRTLFHLRDTPDVDETLNDISRSGDRTWVVWASPDGLALGSNDVWAASFVVEAPPTCEDTGSVGGDDHRNGKSRGSSDALVDVCLNPGARPLLGSVTVTRATGSYAKAETTFAATADSSAVMCVYSDRATAGWVELNDEVEIGPSAFKRKATVLAREVELEASNSLEAVLMGKPGTSYEVRIYGETQACTTRRLAAPTTAQAIATAASQFDSASIRVVPGARLVSLSNGKYVAEPPQVAPHAEAMGCSSTGESSAGVAAFLLVTLWVLSRRVPEPARARRRS